MLAAARETGRHLKCFENFLFHAPLVRAKALLEEGAIGRPLHFRMKIVSGDRQYAWPVPAEATAWRQALGRAGFGGPLLFDHGHHLLAVACWLFGDVRDVFARIEETTLPSGSRRRRAGLADLAPPGPAGPRDLGHLRRAANAHPDRLLPGTRAVRDPGGDRPHHGYPVQRPPAGRAGPHALCRRRGAGLSQPRERLGRELPAVHGALRAVPARPGAPPDPHRDGRPSGAGVRPPPHAILARGTAVVLPRGDS